MDKDNQRDDHRRTKARGRRKDEEPSDVRKAVEEQDLDRARRMEEWRRRYADLLKDRNHDKDDDSRDGHNPPITPFLLIRYTTVDLGARPIPAGTDFWDSPDIWVESSDPFGNPVAGEPNFIHARIFNLGAFQAAPVQVDFSWANPALGLGPANMNPIGTEWVQIPPLNSLDVRCDTPWIPEILNDGHECVMVNCSFSLADPIIYPFQPTLDRHVGQRNLHVVAGKAGQKLAYTLQISNIFPIEMPALVTVQFARLMLTEGARDMALHELGGAAATFLQRIRSSSFHLSGAYVRESPAHRIAQRGAALEHRGSRGPVQFKQTDGQSTSVTVTASGAHGVTKANEMGQHTGALFAALDTFRETSDAPAQGLKVHQLHLEAHSFQTLNVEVDVPADARPGEIFVIHLLHQAGPFTAGGYSVVVVIQ